MLKFLSLVWISIRACLGAAHASNVNGLIRNHSKWQYLASAWGNESQLYSVF